MAAKPLKSNDSKKRKRIAGPKGEERKANPKRLKSPSTNNSQSGSKKPFKASKQPPSRQYGAKPPTQKHVPDTKKQRRLLAKVSFFFLFWGTIFGFLSSFVLWTLLADRRWSWVEVEINPIFGC